MNWVLRNWLVAAASLAILTALGSSLEGRGFHAAGRLLLEMGWGIAGAIAVLDGIRRVFGRPSLLGAERGASRLLALAQIILGLVLLSQLLV